MKKTIIIFLTALLALSVFVACDNDTMLDDLFNGGSEPADTKATITFDGNGNTSGTMASVKVKKGEDFKLTKNAFEKTDYIFTGWNTAADGSGTAYANEGTAKFDKDTTLYAQWIEELTITFNANDGSETPATKTQKVGKGIETALDENTFELSGFTFTKWNTMKDGSGTDYANSAVKTFDSDLELYAQWAANTDTPYVVNHYTKNLSDDKYTLSSTDNETDTTGVLLVLENLKKTIEGFTYDEGFAGTETKGTTKPSSGAVTEAAVLGEGNLVIDLYYSRDSHIVALTKGTKSDNISAITGAGTYAYGASVSVEATIDSGYKFANWIVTGETTEVSTANPYVFTMGASDVAYTANAAPITYTVTFDKNSTSATGTMANQSFKYDTAQNLTPNAYSWENHSFTGWNTSSDGQGTSYADGASVSNLTTTDGATVTLYAQWSEGATVTFHKNDGATPESTITQLIPFNTETALTGNTFSRDTYIFLGWNTAKDGTGNAYSDGQKVTLTANLDLYAQWAIDLATTTLSKTSWTNGNVYSMSANVPISDRITVTGSVTLILPKDKTLTASSGITVTGTNSLTINGEGTLSATGGSAGYAGIGGDGNNLGGGIVTINGGSVTATGGTQAAGIGGGYNGVAAGGGGTVTINGGTVTATGGTDAVGIGGGFGSSNHGALTIGVGYVLTGGSTSVDTVLLGPVDIKTDYTGSHPRYMNVSTVSEIKDSTSAITLKSGVYTTDKTDPEVTVSERITVEGSVFLLLPDGKTLTASEGGITVSSGNTLVIDKYGSTATGTGTLIAGGYGTTPAKTAGIGGVNESGKKNAGTITINGGIVYATGGTAAAGIGGGDEGNGGKVTINGGTVTAKGGENAAGIGGGSMGTGGEISINGGTVTATGGANEGTGGDAGAGIGGGEYGNGGTVTITGGTVTAKGGWGDMEGDGSGAGAGIGGGKSGDGGSVTINGGNVTAQGGNGSGVGIGGGHGSSNHGALTIGTGVIMMVSTNNTDWSVYSGTRTRYMKTPTILTSSTTAWQNDVYSLADNLLGISNRITVSGNVTLILPAGKTLTAYSGITVTGTNSLTINGEGTLNANGTAFEAGIGGSWLGAGGTVTINGGIVAATGGTAGAGIGGGAQGGGGTVTINGGTVTATGSNHAAGIGGGENGAGGTVTINGGTVTATSGGDGAGIGGGSMSSSHGTLKIGTGMALYGDSTSPAQTKRSDATESYTGDRYRYMKAE